MGHHSIVGLWLLSEACAQRRESMLAKESNSASLPSQDDKGFSFLEVL